MSNKICKVDGCDSFVHGLGLCSMHYRRFKKHGSTNLRKVDKKPKVKCSIDDCDRIAIAKEFCSKHYVQKKKLKELPIKSKICIIDGCNKVHESKSFCSMHYTRFKKYGDPLFTKLGRDMEKHVMKNTSEYVTWESMKARCFNENHTHYPNYGGRGITVCDRWKNSFISFYKDMGDKPTPKHQIDRTDNDGNYEPDNCRWVTRANNMRNTSKTKLSIKKIREIRASNLTIKEIVDMYNISKSHANAILNNKIWKNV